MELLIHFTKHEVTDMGEKKKFLAGFLTGIVLTAMVGIIGCVGMTDWDLEQSSKEGTLLSSEHLEKLEYIESLVDKYYLNEADTEKMAEGMYAGALEGLEDPYSRYYTKEEYESISEETEGHYEGIGVVMQQDEQGLVHFVRIYEGAPGDKAGLKAGDILYEVDGESIVDDELAQVAKKIRNPETETVKLTILREGKSDYLEFEIEKEDVQIPVVSHEMLDNHVGYLAIYEFTSVTFEQYQKAFEDLQNQGMERLVVDLRDNPGGLLDSVCSILETILPKGTIVYMEDKYGNRQERSCKGDSPLEIPLAVLVNGNSASASEIFSGAVQDYGIGTIVGTTTYGKGVVQTVRKLSDGSAVKLTISNYYTPSGNNINGKGITPDMEVELDETLKQQNSITKEEDNQLQKAIEVVCEEK